MKYILITLLYLISTVVSANDLLGEILLMSKLKHALTMNVGAADGLGLFDKADLYFKNQLVAKIELKKNAETKSGWIVLEMMNEEELIIGRTFQMKIEKNQDKERVAVAQKKEAEDKTRKDFSFAFNRIGLQFLKMEKDSGYFNSLKFSWVPNFRFTPNFYFIPKTFLTMYKIEDRDFVVFGIDSIFRYYVDHFFLGAGVVSENWTAKTNGGMHYAFKGELGLHLGTFHLLGGISSLSVAGEKLREINLGVEMDF